MTLTAGSAAGTPAHAVSGGETAAADELRFAVKVDIAGQRSCSGALISQWWIVTAASCFADGTGGSVPAGPPPQPTTATIGRTNLLQSTGYVLDIDRLVPRTDRNLVLGRLAEPVRDVAPVKIGTGAPATGEVLRVAGYGRTDTQWVPDQLHTAMVSVEAVGQNTVDIVGHTPADASICKGDAGGPTLREGTAGTELVALHHTSWQTGCLGETETRRGAVETRVDDLAGWITQNSPIPTDVRQLVLSENRIGVLRADGTALVKEGSLSAAWVTEATGVQQLVLSGNRIGVLSTDGTASVKEGALNAGWVTEYHGVRELALSGNRIGVLTTNGDALVKEGTLQAGWVNEHPGVQQLTLSGNRIGVLTTNGDALVKEGTLQAGWVNEHPGVQQLALSGNRIGVLTTNGDALVKEGTLQAGWVNEHPGVQQLALSDNRIGVLTTNGNALVKEGTLQAGWVNEHTGIRQLALSGNRIGVVTTDRAALVKEGTLSAGWVTEYTGA